MSAPAMDEGAGVEESPLGLRLYQAYEFAAADYSAKLAAAPVEARVSATVQTLVKIAERETKLESRVVLEAQDPPLYRVRLRLPKDLTIERVTTPGDGEWSEMTEQGGGKRLTIQLGAGRLGAFSVVILGSLSETALDGAVAAPSIEVLDVQRQQGEIVVQADPAFDVRAADLKDCESVLLSRVQGWLRAEQRPLARLALHYRSPHPLAPAAPPWKATAED